jgi:hypothetical protein
MRGERVEVLRPTGLLLGQQQSEALPTCILTPGSNSKLVAWSAQSR